MRKIISAAIFSLILSLFLSSWLNCSLAASSGLKKLIVFYSPGCHNCIEAKNEVLPGIKKEFKDKIEIEYRDISDIQDYKFLIGLKEKYGSSIENAMPVFFLEGHFMNAKSDIKNNLKSFISESLANPLTVEKAVKVDLFEHFKKINFFVIFGAGLVDGINPCAFTVIVFFISFLALQGYRKKEIILIGLTFIATVFLTYLLIGLGLFGFLYHVQGFWLVSRIINISIGLFSIILGFLAMYDFFKYKKTGQTEELLLQLPAAIKKQIHSVIGMHYRNMGKAQETAATKNTLKLILSALVTGFLVSLLEAVCTGQTYLPTIVYILKTTYQLKALGYFLLYNLMFILPLGAIFVFALFGVTSEQFSKFLRQHLALIKILMAALFFGLGIFLIWRV